MVLEEDISKGMKHVPENLTRWRHTPAAKNLTDAAANGYRGEAD